jgi:broad specificity phosphatase PhoE
MMARIELTERRMGLAVLTDERLDELAERFISGHVRELLGIRFDQYVEGPERFDEVAERMLQGLAALHRRQDEPVFVVLGMPHGPDARALVAIPVSRN